MSKKMLIDATHAEETRVVVLDNGRLDELDVDTSTKKQIKGNIYLAKVVRVEPSLQAAFVDYGGNKHGFLAFGEIHPDYYQIPAADKEALKEQLAKEDDDRHEETARLDRAEDATSGESESQTKEELETVSEAEESAPKRPSFFKKYKIQEVVRQGQVMLIQVVKEERGNKGAALTTYLSLAGRFSVLMPNNGKGGGVSRKITNAKERKELRAIVEKLPIPKGMSVIIRTAGMGKTKAEIKRDYDYLIKTWMNIRDNTLESLAPKLIHEEGDIIKRSLRDVFTTDIEEIMVEGDETFKVTKEFMKILMPNQLKKVKQYKGDVPMFQQFAVENQLEAIHSNVVQLRSGGYIVIDQTEALVAVDVNSGRATKERDIEETALRTNLETCDELARQLKLRDMAGLIVIDFIDMDEQKNNSAVERRLKEALKKDRARIQVGKISGFGLMEMSRQRLHSSFLESSYHVCPCCAGKGVVRSIESCATRSMYLLEEAAGRNSGNTVILTLPIDVASYVLNHKRANLTDLEARHKVVIQIMGDGTLEKSSDYRLERLRSDGEKVAVTLPVQPLPQVPRAENNKPKNNNNGNNNQAQNQAQKPKEKEEKVVAEVSAVVGENSANNVGAAGEERMNSRRARNRRRREWKRNKRIAEQAAREGGVAPEGVSSEKALVPAENHAPVVRDVPVPAVVETAHKSIEVPMVEEHFKVVEQGRLSDVEKGSEAAPIEAKKPVRRGRPAKAKVEKVSVKDVKKVSEAPSKPVEASSAESTVSAQVSETNSGTDETSNSPKKGGWWNRLVK